LIGFTCRILLSCKGIPYETVWLNYEDIERVSKEVGAEPTGKKRDGRPHYTVPFITVSDGSSEKPVPISDSWKIALYIERTFPEPTMIPKGTEALHAVLSQYCTEKLLVTVMPACVTSFISHLVSPDFFVRTRPDILGVTVDEVTAKGEDIERTWKKFEAELDNLAALLDANVTEGASASDADKQKTLVMGDRRSYADIHVLVILQMIARYCPDVWKRIKSRNGGRWERLMAFYAEHMPAYE
jgi:glutathione S-transferase